ncbi:Fe-S cluster assembly transcriptional regulator IscR [Pseudidiomarina sediminum]|uniref:Fe-S cluster assembly transcriptional regulator IscR n=1 Tax=Pseudidiomarina sediminum TaxID=431675 RepID=A0A432Z9N5_9GAMM|nr:Fe-S cluster assembly transcriptional regulator IscR [Pseudidiomarina sediminum]MBY6063791.1 Fe-S cluster assembly transcriptional regulator IscR [Pseudidiomarina sediminum]RUO74600.1 Fe-S cluster assembly transcriptional regulator IscR [Pseudidiomarina sediminum]
MRLTSKGRYAVTAMLDVALHTEQGPVPLADISERQGISLSYLEQLFARLRKQGLVSSVRGPGGGYRLGITPDEISISAVIRAVDESIDATRCGGQGDCQGGHRCLTHSLWSNLSERIEDFLANISLAELVKQQDISTIAERQNAQVAEQKKREQQIALRCQV